MMPLKPLKFVRFIAPLLGAALVVACSPARFTISGGESNKDTNLPQQASSDLTAGVQSPKGVAPTPQPVPSSVSITSTVSVPCNGPSGNRCRTPLPWSEVRSYPAQNSANRPSPQIELKSENGRSCYQNNYNQCLRPQQVSAVDFWLVVDASGSFDRERVVIGEAIVKGFIQATQLGVPVNVSVIAAHSPNSYHSSAQGPVFYQDDTVILRPNMNTDQLNRAKDRLLNKIDGKMHRDPWYKVNASKLHSGADEMGLLGLYYALKRTSTNPNNALAVMFLSDENDVCMGPEFNDVDDPDENAMYRAYCSGINPYSVYRQLKEYAGDRPTVLTAVVYTGLRPVVDEAHNSIGRGYTDLVDLAGGLLFELAPTKNVNFENHMSAMSRQAVQAAGRLVRRTSRYYTDYSVYDLNNNAIDLNSIHVDKKGHLDLKVFVEGKRVGYRIDKMYNQIIPDVSGRSLSIRYCLKN